MTPTPATHKPAQKPTAAKANGGKKQKRPYFQRKSIHKQKNPPLGPPGIIFSCNQGLEQQCYVDAIAQLQMVTTIEGDNNNTTDDLEGELQQLRNSNINNNRTTHSRVAANTFQLYDTRCKGLVIVLWRGDGSNDATSFRETDNNRDTTDQQQRSNPCLQQPLTVWDPVATIECIVADAQSDSPRYPSSRIITRTVPMQMTFSPSVTELKEVIAHLLRSCGTEENPSGTTFAVHVRRRFCDVLTRPMIISAVADVVQEKRPHWKVDLNQPDYVVQVEVCQMLAGATISKSNAAWMASQQQKMFHKRKKII